jgi:hypothetical protein
MAKPMRVKQIPFPEELIEHIERKRSKIGIGFPEYIRHLVLNDIEQEPPLTDQEERNIAMSLKDFADGKYTVLKTKEDVRKHFKKVLKDEDDLQNISN